MEIRGAVSRRERKSATSGLIIPWRTRTVLVECSRYLVRRASLAFRYVDFSAPWPRIGDVAAVVEIRRQHPKRRPPIRAVAGKLGAKLDPSVSHRELAECLKSGRTVRGASALIIENDDMEQAIRNIAVVGATRVRFCLLITPAPSRDGAVVTQVEVPLGRVEGGTVEFVTPNKISNGRSRRSPAVKNSEDHQRAYSQR